MEIAKALWEHSVEVDSREGGRRRIDVPVIPYDEWTAALRKGGDIDLPLLP